MLYEKNKNKTALFGVRGYVGSELLKILHEHPVLENIALFSRNESMEKSPDLPMYVIPEDNSFPDIIDELDICFLATPAHISMYLAPQLVERGKIVIDLSPAFRLPYDEYEQTYRQEHSAPNYCSTATYSLSPWWSPPAVADHGLLIANPGCFATAALMALLPLLKQGLIDPKNIIIDAKSGASGAGRSPREDLLFCEIADNFFPYKVGRHQHVPEINRYNAHFAGQQTNITLVTQILPLIRGIAMNIYTTALHADDVGAAYHTAYGHYPLVKIAATEEKQSAELLQLRTVMHHPSVNIVHHRHDGKMLIFVCIDNLLKGAAGQAIEAANSLLGLPPETGLLSSKIKHKDGNIR